MIMNYERILPNLVLIVNYELLPFIDVDPFRLKIAGSSKLKVDKTPNREEKNFITTWGCSLTVDVPLLCEMTFSVESKVETDVVYM